MKAVYRLDLQGSLYNEWLLERERDRVFIYIGSYSDQVIHIDKDDLCQRPHIIYLNNGVRVRVIVFNATFNNISVISW